MCVYLCGATHAASHLLKTRQYALEGRSVCVRFCARRRHARHGHVMGFLRSDGHLAGFLDDMQIAKQAPCLVCHRRGDEGPLRVLHVRSNAELDWGHL